MSSDEDEDEVSAQARGSSLPRLTARVAELEASAAELRRQLSEAADRVAALRAEVAGWRDLIDSMPQIVWITRPDGWHVHFNRNWCEFTGLTLEESLGHGWNPPFHPEDRERAAQLWDQATRTGEPYEVEYRLRRADGTYHWMLGRAAPLRDAEGTIVRWFGTCTDIEELKEAQARIDEQARALEERATLDPLTGLGNRRLLFDRLELLLGQRQRTGLAVAFLDLDGFKAINDRLGHRVGDDLLVHVAEQLRGTVRQGDVVARIGGDEFVVVGEADDRETALQLGHRLAAAIAGTVSVFGHRVEVAGSVGVAFVGRDEDADADDVVSRADHVMYEVKRASGGTAAIEGRTEER
jgi:diguanylate cyclase (GGDEF)-like protein/PAS domain S-box-containing protein